MDEVNQIITILTQRKDELSNVRLGSYSSLRVDLS
jgi:hypothetical protein